MKKNENVWRKLRVQYCKKDVLAYINNFCNCNPLHLVGVSRRGYLKDLRWQDNIEMVFEGSRMGRCDSDEAQDRDK